ncbi:condensation domain-containing protein, partial [Kitasatospora sp. NPDC001574]
LIVVQLPVSPLTALGHGLVCALARQCDASVFMVLHAALGALLNRLGAGTDLPIGTPVAGRTDDAVDEVVGFFANTLVLRTDTSGNPAFRTLVARAREGDLAAYAHQDLPFERLVELLNPARSMARHPLFQVMLSHQNRPPLELSLGRCRVTQEPVDTGTAKFDLAFEIVEEQGRDGMTLGIEYSTDLFDRATVANMATRYLRVLTAATLAPDCPLGSLELLSDDERHQVLTAWNGHAVATGPTTLVDLFAAQVRRTPDAVALVCGEVSHTFAELDARTDRLARLLASLGAGPERIVALLLPRAADTVTALLAVMRTGAAYLPIDPGYPAGRIEHLLNDARPRLVVTTSALAAALGPAAPGTVLLDDPDVREQLADADRPEGGRG